MEDKIILEVLIMQIISIIVLIVIIIYLFKTSKSIKYERRIGDFALSSINDTELSFFDRVDNLIWSLIRKTGLILKKSTVLKKYATKYEKHITYEDRNKRKATDFLAIKFLLGFFLVILNVITTMFQYTAISIPSYLITFLIGFFAVDVYLHLEFVKKRKQIEEDLLKAIIIMNNAFKSGRNIMQAIDLVQQELTGPIADEFKKIHLDINYGLSLDVVFNRFYDRVKLEEARYISSSLSLLNKTGGNIVQVFASIEKSFFNRKKLKQELAAMTASSTFVFRLLLILPVIFILIIFSLNHSYFEPLYTTGIGVAVLLLIIMLYVLYVLIIKRIMKVEI